MSPDAPARGVLRVAVAPDAPIVVAGLRALLAAEHDLDVVDWSAGGGPPTVEVVLYDPFRGLPEGCGPGQRRALVVVAWCWSVTRDAIDLARAHRARGLLAKDLDGAEMGAALRAFHSGRPASFAVVPRGAAAEVSPSGSVSLTEREADIIHLITDGLSNEEIARRLYLSINSVKTYIRTAYRKIGASRRSQAVLWGVHHGFGHRQGQEDVRR